jgi:putative cell wall-binding protein
MTVFLGAGLSVAGAQPARATTGFTGAFLDSEQLDFVGDGDHYSFSTVTLAGQAAGYLSFTMSNAADTFQVSFAAPAGQLLVPGTYENAQRFAGIGPAYPQLDLFGHGHGCNTIAGRFIVDDATYDSAGNLLTFSARFESHCEGSTVSAMFGALSYNSTAPFRSRVVSADPLRFTSIAGAPVTQSLTITNDGPASDDPTHIKLSGVDASQFSIIGTTCTGPLASGSSCSTTVRFNPIVPSETASAQLSFTDELAPLGTPGEPSGAGSGRFVNLDGAAITVGSITGTVTDPTGAPLADVCVLFVDPTSGNVQGPEAITSGDGSYSINNLTPGNYYLDFLYACDTTFSENYAPALYANAATLADATPVTVPIGTISGINAQLVVGGQITGHVTDSSGQPLSDVSVTAFPTGDVPAIATSTSTDDNGDYTVIALATGPYVVEFDACPVSGACQTQWFDRATSDTDAVSVNVNAGQPAVSGVDAMFAGIGGSSGGGGGGGAAPAGGLTLTRVYGADAIATSIATSQKEFPTDASAPALVLARSDRFADALAGGPLAAAVHGPLVITPGTPISAQLDPRVLSEISRVLSPGATVYVLGGTGALSASIDTTLEARGYKVKRVSGSDQYATAVAIAHQLGDPTTVFEATGLSFADALSAVPAAIKKHAAILLTAGSHQSPATAAYLAAHPSDTRYAIGGPMAAAGADPAATAIYGADLYATSAAVATAFFPAATTFAAATGSRFPDALSGSVLVGTAAGPGPMLLVPQAGALPVAIANYLHMETSTLTSGIIFGGTTAVSDSVASELGALG